MWMFNRDKQTLYEFNMCRIKECQLELLNIKTYYIIYDIYTRVSMPGSTLAKNVRNLNEVWFFNQDKD